VNVPYAFPPAIYAFVTVSLWENNVKPASLLRGLPANGVPQYHAVVVLVQSPEKNPTHFGTQAQSYCGGTFRVWNERASRHVSYMNWPEGEILVFHYDKMTADADAYG